MGEHLDHCALHDRIRTEKAVEYERGEAWVRLQHDSEPRNVAPTAPTVPTDMAADTTTMTPPGRRTQNPTHDARTDCAWYRCGANLSIIET